MDIPNRHETIPNSLEALRFSDENALFRKLEEWGVPKKCIKKGERPESEIDNQGNLTEILVSYYHFAGMPNLSIINDYFGDVRISLGATHLLDRIRDKLESGDTEIFEQMKNIGDLRKMAKSILKKDVNEELKDNEVQGALAKDVRGHWCIRLEGGDDIFLNKDAINDFMLLGDSKSDIENRLGETIIGKVKKTNGQKEATKIYLVN